MPELQRSSFHPVQAVFLTNTLHNYSTKLQPSISEHHQLQEKDKWMEGQTDGARVTIQLCHLALWYFTHLPHMPSPVSAMVLFQSISLLLPFLSTMWFPWTILFTIKSPIVSL